MVWLVLIWVAGAFVSAIVGITLIAGLDEDRQLGARMVIMAPIWPIPLVILAPTLWKELIELAGFERRKDERN